MTHSTLPTPAEALAIAEAVIAARYEGAVFAFVAGSIVRGEGTRHSDIDLVVVLDRIEISRRESFLFEGMPVEAFLHDETTLAHAVRSSAARGRAAFPAMIAEAVVLGPARDRGEHTRRAVAAILAKGPPPVPPALIDAMRYVITEVADDLRGERSLAERLAIGMMLYPPLVELALRSRGKWNAASKWIPRALAEVDGDLAERFDHAFRTLCGSGASEAVLALVEQELAPHGGPLFEGYSQLAPPPQRT